MAETIKKTWLTDEEGNKVAPLTLTSAIQDEDGKAFQEYVDNMIVLSGDETVDMSEDVTTPITNQDIHNIVSDAYDSAKTYVVGDYCIYNNILYKCITAITTAETFNSSKWAVTSVDNEISTLNSNLSKYGNFVLQAVYANCTFTDGVATMTKTLQDGYSLVSNTGYNCIAQGRTNCVCYVPMSGISVDGQKITVTVQAYKPDGTAYNSTTVVTVYLPTRYTG